jgi:hypothetical protein
VFYRAFVKKNLFFMAEQQDSSSVSQQRRAIKFCVMLRKSCEEMLQNVFGTEVISRATEFR